MARKGTFKMQTVERYFQAAPFDWATREEEHLRNAR